MKITNRLDLPQAIVDAVKNDVYTKGDADMSVTGLLRPPRIALLEEKYHDEIVVDASESIWSLFGQSMHTTLERANRTAIAERRLSIDIEGWKVSGGMDVYEEDGRLLDYKVTSVWKVIKGDLDEWARQLNLYAVILRHHGHKVERLQVIALLRDWSKPESERDENYPQAQVVNINIPVWGIEEAYEFMRERVVLHQQASLSNLTQCSKEDRWARDDVYAVMKHGKKRAEKLYSNEEDAKRHVGFDRTLSVTFRPGMSVRCKSYCRVAKWCDQYQAEFMRVGQLEEVG